MIEQSKPVLSYVEVSKIQNRKLKGNSAAGAGARDKVNDESR
jgi:hypothetical protein